jgi:hypothetical protein
MDKCGGWKSAEDGRVWRMDESAEDGQVQDKGRRRAGDQRRETK